MFKLRVISGPNRGSVYEVRDEQCSIGRQDGNTIVLQSSRVSKSHCRLVASDGEILLEDQGSSNGTFVNGTQARSKKLAAGDKISIGEFVLELILESRKPPALRPRGSIPVSGGAQVLAFPSNPLQARATSGVPSAMIPPALDIGGPATSLPQDKPKNIVERITFMLDTKVMPYFYGLMFKHEWKLVAGFIFGLFILISTMVSVQPMIDLGTELVVEEAKSRARFMAKQMAERNAEVLTKNSNIMAESLGFEREPGVRVALLVDLEGRIIAPASRQGDYFAKGEAAAFVIEMRKKYHDGFTMGAARGFDDNSVVGVEPLMVSDPRLGRNTVAAIGVVSIDTERANPAFTRLGTSFADTMTRSAIFAFIALFILYRITLKPFQVLNEDIDRVLRGEMSQVTREFKMEELESLWSVINSALTRIPRSSSQASASLESSGMSMGVDSDPTQTLQDIASMAPFPAVVLDGEGRITYLNPAFENLSNARIDDVRGRAHGDAFGDGIPEYIDALMKRVGAGERGASIDMSTSGGSFQLHGTSVTSAGVARAWLFSAMRLGG